MGRARGTAYLAKCGAWWVAQHKVACMNLFGVWRFGQVNPSTGAASRLKVAGDAHQIWSFTIAWAGMFLAKLVR